MKITYLKITSLLLLNSFVILFFKKIETSMLNATYSWTLSKATPYVLSLIFGILLMTVIKKWINTNRFLKVSLIVLGSALPFLIGFLLNPIYEGDFSKQGTKPIQMAIQQDIEQANLVVITIPGCPFCHESTHNSNLMIKRNPKIKIKYIVCATDSNQLQPYRTKLIKNIAVSLAEDPNKAARIANGSFPAFLLVKNNKVIQKWSNNQFGVRAKDLVEASVTN